MANHTPMKIHAGMRTVQKKSPKGIRVRTWLPGYSTTYAARIPEIAPLAPSPGRFELAAATISNAFAPSPQSR